MKNFRFTVLFNTATDILKAAGAFVGSVSGGYTLANSDGVVTGQEWLGILFTAAGVTLAVLGLYNKKDVPTEETVD